MRDGALPRPVAANAGLDAASGELITFLDHDDEFLDGHLTAMAAALADDPGAGAAYTRFEVYEAGAPYTTERVTWTNGGVRLAGTLYLPASGTKVPAAILLHGSGQMGRLRNAGNRVLYNHAEWLASHGIAVLFYDKRGVGESTGEFRQAGFDVLAGDAAGGLALLRAHPRIDPARLGTVGVSQGAWIATQFVPGARWGARSTTSQWRRLGSPRTGPRQTSTPLTHST